jgi:23S rRNA-/tRNA-specific pseudouridylate synthase
MPLAATFKLPSKKRGRGCVTTDLHTPVSPLSRGELYKIEILNIKLNVSRVELLTGKKNQIRVHFSEKEHPLVSDVNMVKKESRGAV